MHTHDNKRIFLIGYMGSGKSTVGKVLAKTMHFTFIDLDHFIEQRFHKSVSQIFDEDGELRFREIERRMLKEVASYENVIISTGGGTPVFDDNMGFMNDKGITIYLDVTEAILVNRLSKAKEKRPLIASKNDEQLSLFVHESLTKRMPFYETSKYSVDIDSTDLSVTEIVSRILVRLGMNFEFYTLD
ncbi:MAG: shikimate kinase [Bacteroidales bacterium]